MIPELRVVAAAGPEAVELPRAVYLGGDQAKAIVTAERAGLAAAATSDGTVRVVADRSQMEALAAALSDAGHPAGPRLDAYLQPVPGWKLRTRALEMDRPWVMGILNLTEDSFSGDGVGRDVSGALRRAEELRRAGANIVDVGAESARADRPTMDPGEEAEIAEAAVRRLVREGHVVSIDTYKPVVAMAALEGGAEVVNDISGLTLGTGAAREAARAGAGYVLNYSYSVPKRRPDSPPVYADVVAETVAWIEERLDTLREAGLARESIAIDPGIAFGKSHDEDIQVLRRIGELGTLGQPVLLAHSRKNYIGSIGGLPPAERDLETHVSSALAYQQGARIFRVHDAAGARRGLDIAAAIASGEAGDYAPDATSWPWRAGASADHMTVEQPDKAAPAGQRW